MQARIICSLLILLMIVASCTPERDNTITYRKKLPPATLYDMAYESGNWPHPEYKLPFESLGNHRILIEVENNEAAAAQVVLPWRRTDQDPEKKAVIIIDAESGEPVKGKTILSIEQDYAHLAFKLLDGASCYFVYYLPHHSTGGYYPKLSYFSPGEGPDIAEPLSLPDYQLTALPYATIICEQAIDDFHSFYPMEIKATRDELDIFVKANPAPYYMFPEYRDNPISMDHYLPLHWVAQPPVKGLIDTVAPGEYYTYQIGLWSPENDLEDIRLEFSDLSSGSVRISSDAMSCFNLEGKDLNGVPFKKRLDVSKARVQALWCGIEIPEDIESGEYFTEVFIQPEGLAIDTAYLKLYVSREESAYQKSVDPANMHRLKWLNSTLGADHEFIAKPFEAVEVESETIRILGRTITLDPYGFPDEIDSYFNQEMTGFNSQQESILAAGVSIEVLLKGEGVRSWKTSDYEIIQLSSSIASWSTINSLDGLTMNVDARIEYDGMIDYKVSLIATENIDIEDVVLNIPMKEEAAEYMLGLGYKGGKRPAELSWKWDVARNHHEGAWLGSVNKGLQYVLRDENYERPLNTNFYRQKPLQAPPSWYNNGKGGIRIVEEKGIVKIQNYSGPRVLASGDTLHFNIRFLITPFKLIDTRAHFNTRFVHKYVPVDSVVAWNGTIVNVHHANEINPYINYPFYNTELQKAYIDEAHEKGVKVKLYNTIRELSYKAHELQALRSLGYEILNDGKGGGHSWLQEHLRDHYHSAWHATSVNDAAILNKGSSRWTNYYVEGINWLAEEQQIDGLYLDDIAFSRNTVKRLANVLQQHRSEVIIDLHSANQFNERDGYINSAFLYMEHMPYISRLWFGEYFEYDLGPDYWMTEVSGIPFGLTGEMLEGGGHPWRGLVYGMTTRIYGNFSPEPIWKFFDEYHIADCDMLGYWVDRSPIKTNVENIRSTVYIHPDHVMIAIGSWSDRDERLDLQINWKALGMDPDQVRLFSPEIDGLQDFAEFDPFESIPVEKNQGRVLVLRIK